MCLGRRGVISILAGMEAALVESTESWTELLVAHLLHAYPGLRPQVELRSLVRRCRQLCQQQERLQQEAAVSDSPPSPAHALPHIMMVRSDALCIPGSRWVVPGLAPQQAVSALKHFLHFTQHVYFMTRNCMNGVETDSL